MFLKNLMQTVDTTLTKLNIEFLSYERIKDESFASEVYLVKAEEDDFILKFSSNPTKFWRETKALTYLEGKLSAPKILNIVPPDNSISGAIIMSRLEGAPIKPSIINHEVARKCGKLLAQLHSFTFSNIGCFSQDGIEVYPFSNWWEYRKNLLFKEWAVVIKDKVDRDLIKKAQKIFERFYNSFSKDRICLVHCDYRPGNLMLKEDDLQGVIDFESSRHGDRGYDFVKFYDVIGNNELLWKSFLAGYQELEELPDLDKLIPYYELDLNYGFVYWATYKNDNRLFEERLEKFKALLDKYKVF